MRRTDRLPGDLVLESGSVIHDFRQSYVLHGALDAQRTNTILVCASLTGNHHRLDFLIGPARALDTERFCIIVTDPIGNGLSTSPSNSASQSGMAFPRFTIRDMVHAQHRLRTEELGLSRLCAVVGASMGGMQALQWAVSHPAFSAACVAMLVFSLSSRSALPSSSLGMLASKVLRTNGRLAGTAFRSYNEIMPTWDDSKRSANIRKHGYDFRGCERIFDGPVWVYEDK